VAVAAQRADLQPTVVYFLLPLAELARIGEQLGGLGIRLAELGHVAARADLNRLGAGPGDPVEGFVKREQILKDKAEYADFHGWVPPLLDPTPNPLPASREGRSFAAAKSAVGGLRPLWGRQSRRD